MPKANRKINYNKCSQCRNDRQKCLPAERQWPGPRCDRCKKYNYACSANTSKRRESEACTTDSVPNADGDSLCREKLQEVADLQYLLRCFNPAAGSDSLHRPNGIAFESTRVKSQLKTALETIVGSAKNLLTQSRHQDAECLYRHCTILYAQLLTSETSYCNLDNDTSLQTLRDLERVYEKVCNQPALEALQEEHILLKESRVDGDPVARILNLYVLWAQRIVSLGFIDTSSIGKILIRRATILDCPSLYDRMIYDVDMLMPLRYYGDDLLFIAAELDAPNLVRKISVNDGNANHRDSLFRTPLMIASCCGSHSALQALIDAGSELQARCEMGWTALDYALAKSRSNCINTLLVWQTKSSSEVSQHFVDDGNLTDPESKPGETPLHLAARADKEAADFAHLLLENEDAVNIENEKGQTPLHLAAAHGKDQLVELLLNNEAHLNARDYTGRSALHLATSMNRLSTVKILLEYGINVDYQDNGGETALHLAVSQTETRISRLLLRFHANAGLQNHFGSTALHKAANMGNFENSKLLINQIVGLNTQDCRGRSPLHIAAETNCWFTTDLLIYGGACVNVQDTEGRAALHVAAVKGFSQIVRLLLAGGASIDIQNLLGESALHLAVREGHAALSRILLDSKARTDVSDILERTPLHVSASKGQLDTAALLLDYGANVEAQDYGGWTALRIAVVANQMPAVQLLLNKGAAIDAKDVQGTAILHIAVKQASSKIILELLSRGASIDLQDNDGGTALHYALEYGREQIAGLLLENGASLAIEDCRGQTPLTVAKNSPFQAIRLLSVHMSTVDSIISSSQESLEYL